MSPVLLIGSAVAAAAMLALWPRTAGAASLLPKLPKLGKPPPLPAYAPKDFQSTCDPTPKPGMMAFRDWVVANFGGKAGGISRACNQGGKSEHKEGRGWDWYPGSKENGDRMVKALLASDRYGRPHALARMWGIQYLVWYRRMWRAYDDHQGPGPGWRAYSRTGNATQEHRDHVHFTMSRARAADGAPEISSAR